MINGMIQGPLTGAAPDSASASDVTALAATVSTNVTEIALKAQAVDLTLAEVSIATQSGEIWGSTDRVQWSREQLLHQGVDRRSID